LSPQTTHGSLAPTELALLKEGGDAPLPLRSRLDSACLRLPAPGESLGAHCAVLVCATR